MLRHEFPSSGASLYARTGVDGETRFVACRVKEFDSHRLFRLNAACLRI